MCLIVEIVEFSVGGLLRKVLGCGPFLKISLFLSCIVILLFLVYSSLRNNISARADTNTPMLTQMLTHTHTQGCCVCGCVQWYERHCAVPCVVMSGAKSPVQEQMLAHGPGWGGGGGSRQPCQPKLVPLLIDVFLSVPVLRIIALTLSIFFSLILSLISPSLPLHFLHSDLIFCKGKKKNTFIFPETTVASACVH